MFIKNQFATFLNVIVSDIAVALWHFFVRLRKIQNEVINSNEHISTKKYIDIDWLLPGLIHLTVGPR